MSKAGIRAGLAHFIYSETLLPEPLAYSGVPRFRPWSDFITCVQHRRFNCSRTEYLWGSHHQVDGLNIIGIT